MNGCRHEWADVSVDLSGDQCMFSCLHCGKRLEAGPLTSAVITAEQQLGVESEPTGSEPPERTWSTEKPTHTGWYWYRRDPAGVPILFYSGTVWDHLVDFSDLSEPVAFTKEHLLEGEWAGPQEPPQ